MATLIPAVTRHEIARSIYRDIISGRDNFYVFAGKSFESPETPVDTRNFLADVHKNILLAKKIVSGPNDIAYMIRRIDWTAGIEYVAYEDDVDLDGEDFYAMTDDYNIYKCLDNNNGAVSTEKPTSTDAANSAILRLDDGYVWKFMYQVPVLDRIKFLNSDYIPVRNVSDGVNFDVNGVIDSIRIESSGSGYITPYLVVQGDGSEPKSITFNSVTNFITFNSASAVSIADSYINYVGHAFETGDQVLYNDGSGTAPGGLINDTVYYVIRIDANILRLATTRSNAENGVYVTLTSIGSGTTHKLSSSAIDITDSYINFVGHTFETGDQILYNFSTGTAPGGLTNNTVYYAIKIDANILRLATTLNNAENGVYVTLTSIGSGTTHKLSSTGTLATVTTNGSGGIASVTITNSLRGYTHARALMYDTHTSPADYDPSVEGSEFYTGTITCVLDDLTVMGTGTKFTEELQEGWTLVDLDNNIIGVISSITNDTSLELTTYPEKVISNHPYTAFTGGGFQASVILEPETANPINQEVVNQTIHGGIYKVDIDNPGVGYSAPTVEVFGDGQGAVFTIDPTTQISGGTITGVTITSPGQNYNYIRLAVTGINTTQAMLSAHVGPQGGHGANIAKELYARTLCINSILDTSNPDLFEGNDYRQVGIMKNPKLYNDTQDTDIGYFTSVTGTASFVVTVPEAEYVEYSIDDEIETSNGGIYKVVSKIFDEVNDVYKIYLLYLEGVEVFTSDSTLSNNTTSETGLICTEVVPPEFDKNTGTIIYVNNVSPVTRNYEQTESVKLFLNF